jgi:hypothetical protein
MVVDRMNYFLGFHLDEEVSIFKQTDDCTWWEGRFRENIGKKSNTPEKYDSRAKPPRISNAHHRNQPPTTHAKHLLKTKE